MIEAIRTHEIACGHRVYGHESKCAHLHGHNYTFEFHCRPVAGHTVDKLGRVLDFAVIKVKLCAWLERNWDHRFLVNAIDPIALDLAALDSQGTVVVPFNPTAENLAEHMVRVVGPSVLDGSDVELWKCTVWETGKCYATFTKEL